MVSKNVLYVCIRIPISALVSTFLALAGYLLQYGLSLRKISTCETKQKYFFASHFLIYFIDLYQIKSNKQEMRFLKSSFACSALAALNSKKTHICSFFQHNCTIIMIETKLIVLLEDNVHSK